ncbi:MAG: opioid growth factor receptor-related protein [Cyanobacteria bacterium P01_D01_bin.128]
MVVKSQLTEILVPFYLGEKADIHERKIQQMWNWDFETLECAHDYIQWLFPLADESAFNSDAPIVDEAVIQVEHRRIGGETFRYWTAAIHSD